MFLLLYSLTSPLHIYREFATRLLPLSGYVDVKDVSILIVYLYSIGTDLFESESIKLELCIGYQS